MEYFGSSLATDFPDFYLPFITQEFMSSNIVYIYLKMISNLQKIYMDGIIFFFLICLRVICQHNDLLPRNIWYVIPMKKIHFPT